ncbi:dynamin family protein [Pseudacidovorax sp. RU35E]|uniref:dynamin family protein n=1 Tax=Pseudacidovorax sp. RU35E TaxID=1907403 RepID=UPI00095547D2|nr:dynamin family protein [Pseudacidovorax sp. RU35E]SIR74062.1 Dynamin family protein [Pseudacidovorax sp. RU35E]
MSVSFSQQFEQHGAWRRSLAHRLRWLASWLSDNDLLDDAVGERLRHVEALMRGSQVMVAFVAEFSRGKSELINALFFAGYGRRVMPASAGRTTMCPVELRYDAQRPVGLRLLPIDTRLAPQSLQQWRDSAEGWTEIALAPEDGEQLAATMQKVAEVERVPLERAQALGFWREDEGDEAPPVDAQRQVEVPRWRHAVLNLPHPLLEQGLVILDTPGLNAIGAEPELTMSLLPQAHAVLFILGADTGVTRSDLAIWREHLGDAAPGMASRIVALNKIDTLWDSLSVPGQIEAQIERQCALSADLLGVPRRRVLAVSAQKGLQARIADDAALLQASRLPALEALLGQGLLAEREAILRRAVEGSLEALRAEAERILRLRQRELTEQALELEGLRGKNTATLRHMQRRVEQEQAEFEAGAERVSALRAVLVKRLRETQAVLGPTALKSDLAQFAQALRRPGIKLQLTQVYARTFDALRTNLADVQATMAELQTMLHAAFRQLNAEHGFALQAPAEPDLAQYIAEMSSIEQSHLHYLGMGNVLRLVQSEFCERLAQALASRVRTARDAALAEIDEWRRSAFSQMDRQMSERRAAYAKRVESMTRVREAAGSLDGRLAELAGQGAHLKALEQRLRDLSEVLAGRKPEPEAVPASGAAQLRAA